MKTVPSATSTTRKAPRRSPGNLPPPPAGADMLTRPQAAEFFGVTLGTFGIWERDGRVTIQRYRADSGTGRAVFYARGDLQRLREEFRKLQEPHPDPQRPGVYRVPVRTHREPLFALIDAEDLPKVVGKNWNLSRRSGGRDSEVVLSSVKERTVPLKRIVMGVAAPECKNQLVASVNGDPLDCRRANLTLTTWSQVIRNRPKMEVRAGRSTLSKYKGVRWDAQRRLWLAQIGSREQHRALGRFRDEAQAAAAYDAAARELFGESAVLNFPDGIVPAPTFLSPDGQPVREKNAYRVPRGLPTPPAGVAMLTRDEAAAMLEVSPHTFGGWELNGEIRIPRYRVKETTGAPILYAAADIAALREQLDKVGQPYPDPHPARAGVWRVPLRTLDGYIEALIDEADLRHAHGRKWNFTVREGSRASKGAIVSVGPRDSERVQLNRLIMGLDGDEPAKGVRHANGNPLDCRRANLVLSTPAKTTRGAFKLLHRSGRPTSSRFKGVYWNKRNQAWLAQIRIDDTQRKLGLFDDEEDAALAYDEAAREVWGEQARVNFPRAGELPSAAAPFDPAELSPESKTSAARRPGKPRECAIARNDDASVTLSWRCVNAAASAGVSFAVSRRLPGQREFTRIGTVGGTTHQSRVATFTDATVPAAELFGESAGPEYTVQAQRGADTGEVSDVLAVKADTKAPASPRTATRQAA
ncbi:MAG: hypothetical protein IBJ18_07250 [Phycisphaerales bacterium]|nr:hypothetical protein [Phycisphaerales bacterium]